MSDGDHHIRDLLGIPLIVGIVVALVTVVLTFALPKLWEKGKEISYSIDGPTGYLNKPLQGVQLTFNGVPVPNVFEYDIRLWNSGGTSLSNVPIRLTFDSQDTNFKILDLAHHTLPKIDFGKITEDSSNGDHWSKRFTFELLNPKDEDTITLLTNENPKVLVSARSAELILKAVEKPATANASPEPWWRGYSTVLASLAALFASGATSFLKRKLS